MDNIGYVLADRTCNLPPEGWARVAVTAYREFKADRIVAERNFGGDMVRAVLHTVDPNISVQLVTASRGKASADADPFLPSAGLAAGEFTVYKRAGRPHYPG